MIGFELYLKRNSKKMDDYLATFFTDGTHPDMKRYLYGPLAGYSANAGKRHRPLICLLACEAVGGDPAKAYPAAAAIEHFHTAALIHDDIEDSSETRRGEPCLHIREGEGLAINAGDLALSLVTGTVVHDPGMDDHVKLRVLAELVDMTTRTIEGQALDIGWARDDRFDLTVEDYLLMANHKTAYYSGAVPLAVGAIVGGGSETQIATLRAFGMGTGTRVPDPGRRAEPRGHAGSPPRRTSAPTSPRASARWSRSTRCSTRERRERLLATSVGARDETRPGSRRRSTIMREAGSIDFANEYAGRLVADAKAALEADSRAPRRATCSPSMADFFVKRSS